MSDQKEPVRFEEWWEDVGKAVEPTKREPAEEHSKRIAFSAWFAGRMELRREG